LINIGWIKHLLKPNLKSVTNKIKLILPKKGSFIFNVLILMTGTSIAQVIPVVISPILTRIYTPDNFGIFALFISTTSILSVVATGRYELAIMLPKKDEDSINILILSIIITFVVSLLILLTVFIFNIQITKLLNNQEISKWLYFLPLSVLLIGMYKSFNYWSTRKKRFKNISISKVSQSTGRAITGVSLGFLKFGSAGLIIGDLMGRTLATLVLGWKTWVDYKDKRKIISKERIIKNAKKYNDFPKYSTWNALIDNASMQIPVFLLTSFFSSTVTGYYSLSQRIVTIPMGLLSSSLAQVFYEKASKTYNEKGDLYSLVKNVYLKLIKIGIIPFVLFYIFAPDLFTIIFGSGWREAGAYTQILIPWLFFMFLNSPIIFVVIILRKQKEYLLFEIFLFLCRALSIVSGFYMFDSPIISIGLFSSVSVAFHLFLLFYLLYISRRAYAKY